MYVVDTPQAAENVPGEIQFSKGSGKHDSGAVSLTNAPILGVYGKTARELLR
jgi:hypothetical protein